jgi:putative transposase
VAERWVGNCRRDLLDHVIVLNERHLKCLTNEYIVYYHKDQTHLALAKGTLAGRDAEKSPAPGRRVLSVPRLGGLHHRYDLEHFRNTRRLSESHERWLFLDEKAT